MPPVLALVIGIVGLRRVNRSGGRCAGAGLASAGIVLGAFGLALAAGVDASLLGAGG